MTKRGKFVTLKNIAQETGYTINTVSHALRDMKDISPETIAYIKKTAAKMGYMRDTIASSMRTGKTKTIAIILPDISNSYFSIILRNIETTANKDGYSTIILNTDENPYFENRAICTALGKRVDGIIICPCYDAKENLEYLSRTGIPFVLFGRTVEDMDCSSVVLDDEESGYIATKHLIKCGNRRRILNINSTQSISSARLRLKGYLRALEEANITPDERLICEIDTQSGPVTHILHELSEQKVEYDGIFAFSDILALEAAVTLHELGRNVPSDVSIASIDNLQQHIFSMPLLDSVGVAPGEESIGTVSYEILKTMLSTASDTPIRKVLNACLYIRGSVQYK